MVGVQRACVLEVLIQTGRQPISTELYSKVPKPRQTGRIYAYQVIHRIQLTGVVALVVLAGLMVGACGGSTSSPAAATKASPSPSPSPTKIAAVDSCTLVSVDDAKSLTGNQTVANMSSAQVPGMCVYVSSDQATSVLIFSQLFPDSTSAQAVSADQIAASVNSSGGGVANAKVVNGIGDKAVEYTFNAGSQGNGVMIFVFKANVVFLIAVAPAPTDMGKLETLAKKVADGLH
jgi:hypothetical protein